MRIFFVFFYIPPFHSELPKRRNGANCHSGSAARALISGNSCSLTFLMELSLPARLGRKKRLDNFCLLIGFFDDDDRSFLIESEEEKEKEPSHTTYSRSKPHSLPSSLDPSPRDHYSKRGPAQQLIVSPFATTTIQQIPKLIHICVNFIFCFATATTYGFESFPPVRMLFFPTFQRFELVPARVGRSRAFCCVYGE